MKALKYVAACLLLLPLPQAQAAGPTVHSTKPCTYNAYGFCFQWGSDENGQVVTAQSIAFTAPSAGTAVVTSTGSGNCSHGDQQDTEVADLTTQIGAPSSTPDYRGAGAERLAFTLVPATNISNDIPFSLSSQRQFAVKAGQHSYALRVMFNRIDQYVTCSVFEVGLSVLFIPAQ